MRCCRFHSTVVSDIETILHNLLKISCTKYSPSLSESYGIRNCNERMRTCCIIARASKACYRVISRAAPSLCAFITICTVCFRHFFATAIDTVAAIVNWLFCFGHDVGRLLFVCCYLRLGAKKTSTFIFFQNVRFTDDLTMLS